MRAAHGPLSTVAQKLSEIFHQPVVVENQAGASGALGMNMLKRAPADGYTIGVVISLAQTIDLIQNKKASFDIVQDFTPITAIANNPAGLVVNSTAYETRAGILEDSRLTEVFIERVRKKGIAGNVYRVLNKSRLP